MVFFIVGQSQTNCFPMFAVFMLSLTSKKLPVLVSCLTDMRVVVKLLARKEILQRLNDDQKRKKHPNIINCRNQ